MSRSLRSAQLRAGPERLFDYLKLSGINMLEVIFPFHYPTLLLIPLSDSVEAGAPPGLTDNFSPFPCDSLTDFWNVTQSPRVVFPTPGVGKQIIRVMTSATVVATQQLQFAVARQPDVP